MGAPCAASARAIPVLAALLLASGCDASGDAAGTAGSLPSASPWAGTTATGPAPGVAAPSAEAPSTSPPGSMSEAAAPLVTGVMVTDRIGGFRHPWEVRFLPDGTPLVTERPGLLSTIRDGRRKQMTGVPGVVALGEGGLMGLAIDPDFIANRRIYLCFAAGEGGAVRDVRVVRFRVAEDLTGITDATPLVTGIPAGAGNRHLGCRLEIGPDRLLWITTGDAVGPRNPQDPRSRAGKVLRATLAGAPAPGNPGGQWDPYVLSIGHRNPQGLAFRPTDGAPLLVEHGTGCDDEVNLLAAGGNYGWDPVAPGGGYAEQAPMTAPSIPAARGAAWSSGCPTIAPSGASFLTHPQWGQWRGWLAVAVLKGEQLLLMDVHGDRVRATEALLDGDLGRLRMAREAPDGSLWLLLDADRAALVRVTPAA